MGRAVADQPIVILDEPAAGGCVLAAALPVAVVAAWLVNHVRSLLSRRSAGGRLRDETERTVAGVDLDLAEAGRGQAGGARVRGFRGSRVRPGNEAGAPARL